ncbi:hypothetical protein SAMN05421747_103196 [Parapedobacter composti]|uniref:Uncharacterized protein n=1 Tax=Parapedobacter composti TaxID=623281 RepID=A0A1I1G146_9SPHI|nr:hypothetical protein SAMN05421747_103196 [Parapedobacter composti]
MAVSGTNSLFCRLSLIKAAKPGGVVSSCISPSTRIATWVQLLYITGFILLTCFNRGDRKGKL